VKCLSKQKTSGPQGYLRPNPENLSLLIANLIPKIMLKQDCKNRRQIELTI
jgi:hypothetical protein